MNAARKYELLDRIAKGGMAELFRARAVGAEGFSKILAVKRILPGLADEQAFVSMLIDEARVVANLSHPNIVQVFELGKDAAGYFIAMEFVNGPNLGAIFKKLQEQGRTLGEALALDVVIQVVQALDFAHRLTDAFGNPLSVVHRDVSPQNVLVSDAGAVKLGDFGIAKASNRLAASTQMGSVKGKVPYMAPEQIRGDALDHRADQFAAALLLWEALAGQRHYVADNEMQLMRVVNDARIRPLESVGVTVSPALKAILLKALDADPARRYASCAEFARELTLYHRRTYPAHDPADLGRLVRELFGAQLEVLADRLRRFESGEEQPCGWAGGADVASMGGASSVTTAVPHRTKSAADLDATAPALPIPPPPDAPAAAAAPERKTASQTAAPAVQPPAGRRASRASNRAVRPAEPEPKPAPMRDEHDAAIEQALAEARKREKEEERAKNPRVGILGLLAAFALAGGAVYVGGALLFPGDGMAPAMQPTEAASARVEIPGPTPIARPPGAPEPAPLKAPPEPAAPPPIAPEKPKLAKATRPAAKPGAGAHGTLDITCKPECRIEIDGRDTGLTSPAEGILLAEGRHKVRVFNTMVNLRKSFTVDITAGKATRKDVNLVLDP
ncbi:MAG: serine/threonine-protein kinase [Myxococcales bacterium]